MRDSAIDGAQVSAWREQNELLKATFAGVEQEAVPASLRLTPLRFRCVDDGGHAVGSGPVEPAERPGRRISRRLLVASGLCLVAATFAASCLVITRPEANVPILATTSELPLATIPDLGAIGFRFVGAGLDAGAQDVVVFSYRDEAAHRLTLSVARATPKPSKPPGSLSWERDGRFYELTASGVPARRLALAAGFIQANVSPAPTED